MKRLTNKFLLFAVFCLAPVTAQAQWFTLPELYLEQKFRLAPKRGAVVKSYAVEPTYHDTHDGPPVETEVLDEHPRYLALEGGFHLRDFNYASQSEGEYQAFLFGEEDHFGMLIRIDYLNQFIDSAIAFAVGGYYQFHEDTRVGLKINFAPSELIVARQGYAPYLEVGLADRTVVARVSYHFDDYSQANQHIGEFGLDFHLGKYFTVAPRYFLTFTEQDPSNAQFTNHAFLIRASAHIWSMLDLFGQYAFSQHDFEAGAPTPFDAFNAQDVGGGLSFSISYGAGLFFDVIHHDRNNGEQYTQFRIGTYFRF